MAESMLTGCADNCGWAAAILCVLAFGSFGVPVKTSVKVEVDPFILQSYKTMVCFVTSFLVIFLGEEIRWSNWGLASGIFWVPGACAGIYGIRNAGMAIAVGTWSSIIVLTSFIFGIVVFQEKVKNFYYTCYSFLILIVGLVGMAKYAAAPDDSEPKKLVQSPRPTAPTKSEEYSSPKPKTPVEKGVSNLQPMEIEPLLEEGKNPDQSTNGDFAEMDDDSSAKLTGSKDRIIFWGGRMALTRHQTGVIGAVINGAWGGLNLIPLHYARRDHGLSGAAFLVSFATGSLVVNTVLWILLIGYQWHQKKGNWEEVKQALPKFYFEHLWKAGLAAGLLYSLGNFSAMLAVEYLGQGVGFSFCQLQLLVSGLWGVFYFKEIRGQERIAKWFMSAAVAVLGIICLSYQHEGGSVHRRLLDMVMEQPQLLW
ncbi:expressed unknown protein [Seminavis robusta]|uniref:Uncharacterized protein n=1 Tax=Seminavis robusta TaxID=568900 RepID=A0A9N8HPV6_9STRA|nr:expressed unknown protein [Seminavis robusta]|eukprot:Sro1107_g242090.1 n/a (424) ;mRNA; f:19974-21346